jgi:acetylornithine deacetylase/succinyl-diaminopimelate desuccinylase-like protein
MQIDVKLADADLHSGLFGGGVLNPAQALVYILSKLKDQETGKILVPGFLDDVEPISESEHDKLSKVPLSDQQFLSDAAHSKAVYGEEGYTTVERTTARPTLEINGIWGGYQGEGAKTIIPATAHAKVSMRLVGNQDPAKVGELFVDFVKQIAPSEVDVDVYTVHAGPAMLVNPDQPELKIAEAALRSAFEKDVVYARSGGSIPPIAMLQSQLGIKPILMDYGFADDNMHSPNERFSEDQFYRGIECNIAFLTEYSKLNN